MRPSSLLLVTLFGAAGSAGAQPLAPLPGATVPDSVLATMRGGLALPGGIDVSFGIDFQTRVNDALTLHTIYASDGPQAGVHVYTDGKAENGPTPGSTSWNLPGETQPPTIVVTRTPSGTTITPGAGTAPAQLNLYTGAPANWSGAPGETSVAVTRDGPPVAQGPGTFSLASNGEGIVSTLQTPSYTVEHLIGMATGVVVANTANDQTINTVASLNIQIKGFDPALSASLMTANRVALEAVRR